MNLKSSDRAKQEIKYMLILDLRGILYTLLDQLEKYFPKHKACGQANNVIVVLVIIHNRETAVHMYNLFSSFLLFKKI